MSANYFMAGPEGQEHIPAYPKGFIAARIVQLVLAVICLGLAGYAVSLLPISGAGLTVFTSVVSILSSIYLLVAHFSQPIAYNYWAVLGLEIFHVVFWLIAFAVLASQAAVWLSYTAGTNTIDEVFGAVCGAGAGLGALQWVSYIVTLTLHSLALHRHRKAGLHALPGRGGTSGAYQGETGGPAAAEKIQLQAQQPQQYQSQQPQPTHTNQPAQQHYQAPISEPSEHGYYNPDPRQATVSPVYPANHQSPPPQQTYEAPYAGIAPAERYHEVHEEPRQ
ncbi:hypothetical protein GGS20DRAFT_356103 [Poronia punctata]|nr:hypothetical protein GGS20DRAFT_356103 [Poronia punctata]